MDHQQVLQRGPVTSSRAHATQRQAEETTVRLGRREGERVVREEMRGEGERVVRVGRREGERVVREEMRGEGNGGRERGKEGGKKKKGE